MKKTLKLLVSILAVALIGVGCNKMVNTQSKEIKGKIFVSSTGGNSYKLGSVKISLVNVDDLNPLLNDFIVKRKAFDQETETFIVKIKDKAEIIELRRDREAAQNLKEEIILFVIMKGMEFSTNVTKVYDVASVATTSSDADGEFSLPIPASGKYAIMARDMMITSNGEPQSFMWLIRWNGESNVMLNNINMTDVFTPSNEKAVSELEKLISDLNK